MGSVEFTGDVDSPEDGPVDQTVDHVPDNMASHFAGAYKKGAIAFREGEDRSANPYDAQYNPQSAMGGEWGHVWANAWWLGWTNEQRKQNGESLRSYRKRIKVGR
jgi:hypothetical protein